MAINRVARYHDVVHNYRMLTIYLITFDLVCDRTHDYANMDTPAARVGDMFTWARFRRN